MWGWELAKILVPVITTIIVGIWISRSNEKLKSNLTKDVEKYKSYLAKNTERFKEIYPRRVAALEQILALVRKTHNDVEKALGIIGDEAFYLGNIEHRDQDLTPVNNRSRKSLSDLEEKFTETKMFLNDQEKELIRILIESLKKARGMVVQIFDETTDESFIRAESTDGYAEATKLIQDVISKQIEKIDEMAQRLVIE